MCLLNENGSLRVTMPQQSTHYSSLHFSALFAFIFEVGLTQRFKENKPEFKLRKRGGLKLFVQVLHAFTFMLPQTYLGAIPYVLFIGRP